ncbi:electron carrier/ protein disulfide oxidoreductase [Anaeramoeba flamelloides]|uniref:Electron carrier/ protein disulfide oxidoreductase n=1 Tax=Anaeramoeba flamelloides TaxID=1746091 RepID=A0AAV8AHD0_9EUKA|nr:electron carrier/ protein disulfide oxidoreductase [Anaeramoeba flamelloides]
MSIRVQKPRSVSDSTSRDIYSSPKTNKKITKPWKKLQIFKGKSKAGNKNIMINHQRNQSTNNIKKTNFDFHFQKRNLEKELKYLTKKLKTLRKRQPKSNPKHELRKQELKVKKLKKILKLEEKNKVLKAKKNNKTKLQRTFRKLQKEYKNICWETNGLLKKLKNENLELAKAKKENQDFYNLKQSTKVGRQLLEAKEELLGVLQVQYKKVENRERKIQFEIDQRQMKIDPENELLKTHQIVSQTLIKIQFQKKERKNLKKKILEHRELIDDLSERSIEKAYESKIESETDHTDNTENTETTEDQFVVNKRKKVGRIATKTELLKRKKNKAKSQKKKNNQYQKEQEVYINFQELDSKNDEFDSKTSDNSSDNFGLHTNNVQKSHMRKQSDMTGLLLNDHDAYSNNSYQNLNHSTSMPDLKIPKEFRNKPSLGIVTTQSGDSETEINYTSDMINFQKKKKLNEMEIQESNNEITSLEQLLAIPTGVDYFKEFLCQGLNQENIMFFQEVKNLKNSCPNLKQLEKASKRIFEKFIKPESLFEINIISEMRKEIIKNIQEKNYSLNMFDEAQEAVFSHMNLNSWKDFQESLLYFKLIKSLRNDPKFIFSPNLKKLKLSRQVKTNNLLNDEINQENGINNTYTLAKQLLSILMDLLDAHYSVSRKTVNLKTISKSISFQKFVNLTGNLQLVDLNGMSDNERLAFFLNVYNTLFLHSLIVYGFPCLKDRNALRQFFSNHRYLIGSHYFSLDDIYNGILRGNNNAKLSQKYFKSNDIRQQFQPKNFFPNIHFACYNFHFQNKIQIFHPNNLIEQLNSATQYSVKHLYLFENNTLFLPKFFEHYQKDFNGTENLLGWFSIYYQTNEHFANYRIKFNQVPSKTASRGFFFNLNNNISSKFMK